MNKKSNLTIFLFLIVSVIMLSVSTTLALVRDDESKVGNIIKFDKVAIMGEVQNGSKLSLNIEDKNVGNTIEIIGDMAGEPLYVKPAEVTKEMYIRFRVYFSFGDDELDILHEEALKGFLSEEDGLPVGFELYDEGVDYDYVKSNGWAYLVTKDSKGNENYLKVVTSEHRDGFILCDKYVMNIAGEDELTIINVIEENQLGCLQMKVEVEAIQAFGLADLVVEDMGNILSSSNTNLEELFNYATVTDYERAEIQNRPTIIHRLADMSWEEVDKASNYIKEANKKLGITNGIKGWKHGRKAIINEDIVVRYTESQDHKYGEEGYVRTFAIEEISTNTQWILSLGEEKTYQDKNKKNIEIILADFLHDKDPNGNYLGISFNTKYSYAGMQGWYENYIYLNNRNGYLHGGTSYNNVYPQIDNIYNSKTPDDLKSVIKLANIKYKNGKQDNTIKNTNKYMWLLSAAELFYKFEEIDVHAAKEGDWYPIYTTNESRQKGGQFWTRTTNTYSWYCLASNGTLVNESYTPGNKFYLNAVFCI